MEMIDLSLEMQPQAQVLPDLHADGAGSHTLIQPLHRPIKKSNFVQVAPVHPRDRGEAARGRCAQSRKALHAIGARFHGDVH